MKRSTLSRAVIAARLGIILLVVFGCLYRLVLVRLQAASKLDQQIQDGASQIEGDLKVLKSGRRLLEIEQQQHRDWEIRVLEEIPTAPEVNEVLGVLSAAAAESGLKLLTSFASDEEEFDLEKKPGKAKATSAKPRFFRIPLSVEVTGEWMQIASFLDRIRGLGRQLRISGLTVSRKAEFFPAAHAHVSLFAYHCREAAASEPR